MKGGDGLIVAVTGAAGFVGKAVIDRIDKGALGPIADLRLNDLRPSDHASATVIEGSFAEAEVRDRLIGDGVDVLFHLASLPGGAAEQDPVLGRQVNLDGSIALLDRAARPQGPVVVYTSSIAVLGRATQPVTDATPPRPSGSYGTHKAMVELYIADLTRRGLIDGRTVRPAGVVARPRQVSAGFATAWMSELFHAANERHAITVPSRLNAHIWLQSIDIAADNITRAALMPATNLPSHRAWTLPTTMVRIDALVDALSRHTGHAMNIEYGDGPTDHPPLDASSALALGFVSDGEIDALVANVLIRIARS